MATRTSYPRLNVLGQRMPLPVYVPGTKRKAIREIEGSGKCTFCRNQRKTLYSYEESGEAFCNREHWMTWLFEGRQSKQYLRRIDEVIAEHTDRLAQASKVVSISAAKRSTGVAKQSRKATG